MLDDKLHGSPAFSVARPGALTRPARSDVIAEFDFPNQEALGPAAEVFSGSQNGVLVRLERAMRLDPLPGMKQPTPPGAILGMESRLAVLVNGKAAAGYRWQLRRQGRLVQRGVTDEHGQSRGVDLDLPHTGLVSYKLTVLLPRRRRR